MMNGGWWRDIGLWNDQWRWLEGTWNVSMGVVGRETITREHSNLCLFNIVI